jgi:sulfur-carrier protein
MIEVKYFGAIAERTYCQEEKFSFSELPLEKLVATIKQKYQLEQLSFRVAINKKIVDKTTGYILKSDDIIALLPPFAGG